MKLTIFIEYYKLPIMGFFSHATENIPLISTGVDLAYAKMHCKRDGFILSNEKLHNGYV
jgi:hypothetical protein